MRVLIVDDEPIARQILREHMSFIEGLDLIGEAGNGLEALQMIEKHKPDVVFLDLEMPLMGGLEVVRNLDGPETPVIIIVTAFDAQAIRAFEVGAVDYLLKPVNPQRLAKTIERASKLLTRPAEASQHAQSLTAVVESAASVRSRKIVGRDRDQYFLLDSDEVLAFVAEGDAVWILTNKRWYSTGQSLRAIEDRTKHSSFQRVHRNAIVNVNHVKKMSALSSQRLLLTLSNSLELTVSKRQAQNVRHVLNW